MRHDHNFGGGTPAAARVLRRALLLVGLLGAAGSATAAPVFQTVNEPIPEYPSTGLGVFSTINLTGYTEPAASVRVFLEVSGNYNGDLYVYLTHNTKSAVLLNRVGRTAGGEYGYGDGGVNLTFDDTAANGDVHVYRQTLFGNHTTPLAGPLTGTWAPDARLVSPATVTEGSTRDSFLSAFVGTAINGSWTLFATDYATGNTHELEQWGLEIIPVPEPRHVALAALVWAAPSAVWLRRRRVDAIGSRATNGTTGGGTG